MLFSSWTDRSFSAGDGKSTECGCNSSFFATLSVKPSDTTGVTPGKRKNKAAETNDSTSTSSATLSVWKLNTRTDSAACTLMSGKYATTSSVAVASGESVAGLVFHAASNSLSVVLSNAAQKTSRWVKYNVDGSLLFERQLEGSIIPVYATEVGEQLCIITSDRSLLFYDTRYGTEVRRVPLDTSASICATWVVLYESDASKLSTAAMHVITCMNIKAGAGGPFNLYRRAVYAATGNTAGSSSSLGSSLCRSLGKLKGTASAVANTVVEDVASSSKRSKDEQVEMLKAAQEKYDAFLLEEKRQEKIDVSDATERASKKQKLHMDINVPNDVAVVRITLSGLILFAF
jgi:hypothetical protein